MQGSRPTCSKALNSKCHGPLPFLPPCWGFWAADSGEKWRWYDHHASGERWKLADFGLASRFKSGSYMEEVVGTQPFKAPEVEKGYYTEKCDVYSISDQIAAV